ncbi:MAG: hypothetical protein K2W95_17560 [Candidatus Obscuribacterales bacterium]|nr:hypothetical protein [Candidatus Obscuribacterales bacterium]
MPLFLDKTDGDGGDLTAVPSKLMDEFLEVVANLPFMKDPKIESPSSLPNLELVEKSSSVDLGDLAASSASINTTAGSMQIREQDSTTDNSKIAPNLEAVRGAGLAEKVHTSLLRAKADSSGFASIVETNFFEVPDLKDLKTQPVNLNEGNSGVLRRQAPPAAQSQSREPSDLIRASMDLSCPMIGIGEKLLPLLSSRSGRVAGELDSIGQDYVSLEESVQDARLRGGVSPVQLLIFNQALFSLAQRLDKLGETPKERPVRGADTSAGRKPSR